MPILESHHEANNSNSDVVNHDAGQYDESLAGKLVREVGLLSQMPGAALQSAVETLNDPGDLALKLSAGFFTAVGIAGIKNNPNAFGATLGSIFKFGVGVLEKSGLAVMAIDWGGRIGAPMAATWESGAKDAEARKAIGQNVGEGLVYYSVGFAGFASGRRLYSNESAQSTSAIAPRLYRSELAGYSGKSLNSPALERAFARQAQALSETPTSLSSSESFLKLAVSAGFAVPRVLTAGDSRNYYDRYKI
ncbi:MAG: hypothetical protein QG574_2666 [Cyanobacteriota bacterium erpe_2018_sw_21hr_WHONDRS-SW48-000092_B_bin.40]|jgi:hypothetical protein|nr:hypothetical protein [Cyanobacteriota bacterium erpe_2018_sw_21hr_WHONDRS-SW48-000092_B_bin.40]